MKTKNKKPCKWCGQYFDKYKLNSGYGFCSPECRSLVKEEQRKKTVLKIKNKVAKGDKNTIVSIRYNRVKLGAKKRGINFNLDKKFFSDRFQNNCHYCGDKHKDIGFDRIDNELGYTTDNVVVCCFDCNKMKNDKTRFEFMHKISSIYENWF